MSLVFFFLIIFSYSVHFLFAYYGDPTNQTLELSPVYGGALVNVGDDLYYLGGRLISNETSIVSDRVIIYNFTSNNTLQEHVIIDKDSPFCFPCKGYLLPDNKTIVIMGEHFQDSDTRLLLRLRFFDTNSMSWLPVDPSFDNDLLPIARYNYTSAISPDGDALYLIGGRNSYMEYSTGIIRYDLINQTSIVNLAIENPSLNISLCGGSAEMLPNGIVLIVFGNHRNGTLDNLRRVLLFDTKTNSIRFQSVNGYEPLKKVDVSSTLGPDKTTIYYYGGWRPEEGSLIVHDDFIPDYYRDTLAILDTNTWFWLSSEVAGIKPVYAYQTSMAVFNRTKIFVSPGLINEGKTTSVAVLRNVPGPGNNVKFNELQWFTNYDLFDNPISKDLKSSGGIITGVIIGSILFFIIGLFILRKYHVKAKNIVLDLYKGLIRSPRSGEPMWAETLRLIIRFIFFLLLLIFIVYAVYKSVKSPTVTQRSVIDSNSIPIPDIRFCFIGFNITTFLPFIRCNINGMSCNSHLFFTEKTDQDLYCLLFYCKLNFINRQDFGYADSITTKIVFTFFGEPLIQNNNSHGMIYIDFYPIGYDPELEFKHDLFFNKITKTEYLYKLWRYIQKSFNTIDTIILRQGVVTTAFYTLTTVKKLKANNLWNLIGFSPKYDEYMTVQTFFRDLSPDYGRVSLIDRFNETYISQLTIQPNDFVLITETEERVFSLLNAFAQVGGVLGLLASAQVVLFGFRPQSPWGIIHRWSYGNLSRRLTDKLANHFNKSGKPVPLFDPVSSRLTRMDEVDFGSNNSAYLSQESSNLINIENGGRDVNEENNNLEYSIEERLQFLEHVLKSYYLDDEIFRSLKYTAERNRVDKQFGEVDEDKKTLSVTQNEATKDRNDSKVDVSSENFASSSSGTPSITQIRKPSLDDLNSNARLLPSDKDIQ